MQLQSKTAIVTGGGRGIGRGIVDRFLAEGALVAVVQRRPLDDALARRPGVFQVAADLRDPASVKSAVHEAVEQLGAVDIIVNNAGMMVERTVDDLTVEEWDRMMAVNVRAPLFLIQSALPHLRARGAGSIISTGSIEGIGANPVHTAYSASKGAVHAMTKALAVDLGGDGIRCNAIAPGWIASELSEEYLATHPDPQAARESLDRIHPLGRLGAPEDIGDVAVFLASDASRFMTGEVLVVDGGRLARLPTPF